MSSASSGTLIDLPERWEAVTRHRGSEGSAYLRHFRMGVCNASGQPKPAAERLFAWATRGVGVCEWVYWREAARFEQMVALLRQLGIRRVRTGIGSRGPVPSPRKSPDSPGRLR